MYACAQRSIREEPLIHHSFAFYCFAFLGLILGRYFLLAGVAHFLFYCRDTPPLSARWLRRKPPTDKSIRSDIELSIYSAAIFALCGAVVMMADRSGATLLYADIDRYGWWYLGISFAAVLCLQDTYFYFVHRLFHHPALFRLIHYGHHRSGDPTPWTSFAFDLPEAIVQAIFFAGIVFIVPVHFAVLGSALIVMTIWSIFNHLGLELFPASFARHWLGKWAIGSTHHSYHHRDRHVHFGLYFTFWDRLLGTQDPDYDLKFDRALNEVKQQEPSTTNNQLTRV
jgi:sterol desaturase/sphingolipid hydroxylase (fatty acid hydroxylase superfamily)